MTRSRCSADSSGDGSHLSGETPGAAVSTSGRIFCSNAGDVEAYIWQDDRPYPLTRKHTAHDDAERRRVEAQGGRVVVTGRSLSVNSVSATTRGLGERRADMFSRLLLRRQIRPLWKFLKASKLATKEEFQKVLSFWTFRLFAQLQLYCCLVPVANGMKIVVLFFDSEPLRFHPGA